MQISQDFIQKIKDNIIISEFLHKYIQIIPAGNGRHKALCPFHNEKTPSFLINDDRGSYHCFGCGAHGDIISFLLEKENYNFIDAVKYLANLAGLTVPEKLFDQKSHEQSLADYDIFLQINNFFTQQLSNSQNIQGYLAKRGVTEDLIKYFNIGYAPSGKVMNDFIRAQKYSMSKLIALGIYRSVEGREPYFLFYNRVIFPIKNHSGHIIAFGGRVIDDSQPKYLNSPEHQYFKKREILFNWYNAKETIKEQKTAIVCEGYMDVIALQKYGFTNAVAPLGTAFSDAHLKILWQYSNRPIICLDGDIAGRKAMLRVAELALPLLLPGKNLAFNLLPKGQDPDDFLKQSNGKEQFKLNIDQALSLEEVLLRSILPQKDSFALEERSVIIKSLQNYAYKISDKIVQKQYLQYFNQAIFSFFRKKKYHKNISKTNMTKLDYVNSMKELDLLLFVSSKIDVLNDEVIEEEFSFVEFTHPELTKIQTYLLEVKENFDYEIYINWLGENIVELKELIISKLNEIKLSNYNLGWDFFFKSYYLEKLNNDRKKLNMLSQDEFNRANELQKKIFNLEQELNQLALD